MGKIIEESRGTRRRERVRRNIACTGKYTDCRSTVRRNRSNRSSNSLLRFSRPILRLGNVRGARRKRNISGRERGPNELNRGKRNPRGRQTSRLVSSRLRRCEYECNRSCKNCSGFLLKFYDLNRTLRNILSFPLFPSPWGGRTAGCRRARGAIQSAVDLTVYFYGCARGASRPAIVPGNALRFLSVVYFIPRN